MPNYTSKLHLKKPLQMEYYNVDDFNNNFEILDKELLSESRIANCFNDLINDGVVNLATDFLITYNNDMSVSIGAGSAWHNGNRVSHSGTTVNIDPVIDGDSYVTISVGYNPTTKNTFLSYVQGETPTPPDGVLLYTITISPSTTEITSENVEDGRTQITLKL